MPILEHQTLINPNNFAEKIQEMRYSNSNLDTDTSDVLVPNNLVIDFMMQVGANGIVGYGGSAGISTYSSFLEIHTHFGAVHLRGEAGLDAADFIVLDKFGNRHSYSEFKLNQMVENLVLKDCL